VPDSVATIAFADLTVVRGIRNQIGRVQITVLSQDLVIFADHVCVEELAVLSRALLRTFVDVKWAVEDLSVDERVASSGARDRMNSRVASIARNAIVVRSRD
jgi:hypothetical protein